MFLNNPQMQRAASCEDIDLDKERDRPPRYRGRHSLQQKPLKDKKHKSRQWSPKHKLSLSEYQEEYMTVRSELRPNTSKIKVKIDRDFSNPPSDQSISPELEELRRKLEKLANETEKDKDNLVIPKDGGVQGVKIDNKVLQYGEALWLNLVAFLNNRSMTPNHIHRSVVEQYAQIVRLREEKSQILTEIQNFRFDMEPEPRDLSWLRATYHPVVISNVRNASEAVNSLLKRFEEFLELFPTFKSMTKTEPKFTPEVSTKINLLYVWQNSVNELFNRILEIKEYFEIITDAKRKRKNSISTKSPTSPESPILTRSIWPTIFKTSESPISSSIKNFNSEEFSEAISNMYVNVVGRSLRLRGMTVVLDRIRSICERTLEKAAFPLQIPKQYAQAASIPVPKMFQESSPSEKKDLSELTVNHKFFKEMNLPSFYHQFFFLLRIPVDLVHQWLKMRSEKVICKSWDLLTLNTLIEDSYDCLSAAIGVKIRYMDFVVRTTQNPLEQQRYLESFDMNLDVVFQNYLGYIRYWAQTATANLDVDVEWCEQVITVLKSEWYRAKVHSVSVSRGEAAASQLFCNVAKDLMNQIVRSYLAEKLDSAGKSLIEEDFDDDEPQLMDEEKEESLSSSVFVLCREFREMIRHLRERSMKGISFIKLLSEDLEICAKYSLSKDLTAPEVVKVLLQANHVILKFSNFPDCPFLVLCPLDIVNKGIFIEKLLNSTYGNLSESNSEGCSDYVILIPTFLFEENQILNFQTNASSMSLSLKTTMTLEHYVTPTEDLYLIAENKQQLNFCRKKFEKSTKKFINLEYLKISDDFCSCNDQISHEMADVKEIAFETSNDLWACAQDLEKLILNGKNFKELSQKEISTMKATLKQAFNLAFEFDREMTRLISIPKHPEFAERAVKNVCIWTDYVIKTSEEGARITSRWAAIPLNCLQILISNQVAACLKSENLEILTKKIKNCIEHISDSSIQPSTSTSSFRKVSEVDDYSQYDLSGGLSGRRVTVQERIKQTVDYVEKCRQGYLEENRKVGRIIELSEIPYECHFLRSKKAPFEWQRLENKILGVGSFGTCYLVMNMKDNCLMAMKQVKVVRENNENIRSLVDEVDIFRQLNHPNLVKYFGIEIHKDEVLIFMEYCSGGTLARVCREGLDLDCVRRYTNFLLKAVDYLHMKQIVHRDIKPANIFLTQQDILKLGDFGCSFRIEGPATRKGEIITHVGTISYQAPELQTNAMAGSEVPSAETKKSLDGYGRAVDIWATGCVVLEMITGKPPYYQLNNECQIIFQLGSGIPPKLTPEIENNEMTLGFLKKCLTVNPNIRPTAADLLQDTFANIDTEVYDCAN